jgi:hypothetical protein
MTQRIHDHHWAERMREFEFEAKREEENLRRWAAEARYKNLPATPKQLAFWLRLVAERDLTLIPENVHAILEDTLRKYNEEKVVPRNAWISASITRLKALPKKGDSAPVAEVAPVVGEEASAQQKGFIKSLVAKREVSADILATVDEALLSKTKASKLIALLMTLPEKSA